MIMQIPNTRPFKRIEFFLELPFHLSGNKTEHVLISRMVALPLISRKNQNKKLECTPLWTEFLTHACENITFPQLLLRTVTIQECHYLTNGRSAIKGRAQNIKPSTAFDISKFKTLKQNFKRSIFLSGHILQHYNSFTISHENWPGSTIFVLTQACTRPETKLLQLTQC